MPRFTPPTQREKVSTPGDRLFSRYGVEVGLSVVKTNGVYTVTPYPWLGDLEGLKDGVDYFLGGRDYTVSVDVALALEADGFAFENFPGYGEGGYGMGTYGG